MNFPDICPVCQSDRTEVFLERYDMPVHQNLVMETQQAALEAPKGDLILVVCDHCGFVFNRAFDLSQLRYGKEYDNTQLHSPYFSAYLQGLANYLIEDKGVRNSTIVEVGSGKGHFLRALVRDAKHGNVGIGFDPSHEGPNDELDGRLRFYRRYYDSDCTDIAADVVVCRHVIEHVPDPLSLLKSVRQALASSQHARVFFETPCVEWIFEHQVIWDFFYEHCSLFTETALRAAFARCGFHVHGLRRVFQNQYFWIEASVTNSEVDSTACVESHSSMARDFGREEARLRRAWMDKLRAAAQPIALWGAGAKGATFVNLVDPDRQHIQCVIDLNPRKQGGFIGGTGHPIVDYKDIATRGIRTVFMMNPNYLEESRQLLETEGISTTLLSVDG